MANFCERQVHRESRLYVDKKCGFDLPSDNVLVQTSKQCAIRSGFNTRIIQDMCRCFVGAGLR
ncbi:unnamed protein product [Toxocara canis]|uniref:ZP domain-containing protein n=1 Tax=Toxocara canis TaxID=6265 RepID=A0A183U7H1_TOXCA|nr:unnamed protein product [Toxocara canis]